MRHFPIFLDLQGRHALVLGGGEIAHAKAASLQAAGAQVRLRDRFDPADLAGCAIAIGADAALSELEALSAAARQAGIPVNVVDRPDLCGFIMPAIVDRDPVTIAISTGGAAPLLARLLRARIEAAIPPAFARLAALGARLSQLARAVLPALADRRRVLERVFTGAPAELVFAGREEDAYAAATAMIAAGGSGPGIVHLVGAGPGAADLLTLRAQRLLGEADVVVYDRLVSPDVLDLARRDATRVHVGKARANHCMPQEEINALLIRLARAGHRVVRLKGGDPLVFGRGGEEADALAQAGIACEIVPGITAALACAADAGIPLTHRDHARTVTFATGHTRDGRLDLDFAALARTGGTLAIYMGLHTLPGIRDGLLANGLAPGTPAALVENGGTSRHRLLTGTLASLAAGAADWHCGGPTLLLIGAVVGAASDKSLRRTTRESAL